MTVFTDNLCLWRGGASVTDPLPVGLEAGTGGVGAGGEAAEQDVALQPHADARASLTAQIEQLRRSR